MVQNDLLPAVLETQLEKRKSEKGMSSIDSWQNPKRRSLFQKKES